MKVYKYRGGSPDFIERDINSIAECYFWAPTAEDLNDPAEALLVQGEADRVFNNTSEHEVINGYSDLIAMRSSCGIYSLSKTPLDELMWAYYGDGHQGFCIEYDLERLVLEARNQWDIVDEMKYLSRPPEIQAADILSLGNHSEVLQKMLGTKSTRWAHEEELRIVTTSSGKNFHAAQAITGIHFGVRCSEDIQRKIRISLSGSGYNYRQVRLIPESYQLESIELVSNLELDGNPEVYLAEIEEKAVPTSEDLGKYGSYLPKIKMAVEFVSRDPSCKKIVLADVSTMGNSDLDPQIYVQYETRVPTNLCSKLNRYFKLDEIPVS